MDDSKKNEITIELKPEVAEGSYANLAIISHSASEFILDFARVMPGSPKGEVKSRVIMTPDHVKRLLLALQDNIRKYEEQFGTINIGGSQIPNKMFFSTPHGEA